MDPDAKRGISPNFLFVTKKKLQIIWISPNLDQSHSNNPDTKSCDFGYQTYTGLSWDQYKSKFTSIPIYGMSVYTPIPRRETKEEEEVISTEEEETKTRKRGE